MSGNESKYRTSWIGQDLTKFRWRYVVLALVASLALTVFVFEALGFYYKHAPVPPLVTGFSSDAALTRDQFERRVKVLARELDTEAFIQELREQDFRLELQDEQSAAIYDMGAFSVRLVPEKLRKVCPIEFHILFEHQSDRVRILDTIAMSRWC